MFTVRVSKMQPKPNNLISYFPPRNSDNAAIYHTTKAIAMQAYIIGYRLFFTVYTHWSSCSEFLLVCVMLIEDCWKNNSFSGPKLDKIASN